MIISLQYIIQNTEHGNNKHEMTVKVHFHAALRVYMYAYWKESAYCSDVTRSVCSAGHTVESAEQIEMPFRRLTRAAPMNHVLNGVEIPHRKGQFWGVVQPTE